MRSSLPKLLLPALVLGLWPGCRQQKVERAPLRVESTSPPLDDVAQPVLLNDSLTVYFSEEILPLSVTPDSVTVLDDEGHQVHGALQVGSDWVTFLPDVPLARDLLDGSFRPGARYRLMLAGYPRPDAIRTRDGRWLESAAVFDVFVATDGQQPPGLPSLLRPPANRMPLMLRQLDEQVPADAPLLQLHFTQPLLPSSVIPENFEVQLLEEPVARLMPRSVRLVTSPIDVLPGCTVEIDLGAIPQREDGSFRRLQDGDWICVLAPERVRDLAGEPPFSVATKTWPVAEGSSLPLCEWPGDDLGYSGDELLPGFEVRPGAIRPRVRVEAGTAQLGAFRPLRDTVLRPGQPFDRGDGKQVVSEGSDFCFLSIDVPAGVTVTVDATGGPVRLRACGGVRIAGDVVLQAAAVDLPRRAMHAPPVEELIAVPPMAIVAAGNIDLRGAIRSADRNLPANGVEERTRLLLATAGRLRLAGALPFQTMLVAEALPGDGAAARIEGPRGQNPVYPASFTYGLAPSAQVPAHGVLPWRQLPEHLDSGALQLLERQGRLQVSWQSAPADPIRPAQPDLSAGLVGRWQAARDRDVIVIGTGGFVRFELRCELRAGEALPSLRGLRVVAN